MVKLIKNGLCIVRRVIDVNFTYPSQKKKWATRGQEIFEHKTKDGLVFFLDGSQLVDQLIFVEGIYEKRLLDNLRGFFDEGAIAVDIGANIGNHSIYLSQDFQEIHCFEPNPETFGRLSRNVAANGLSNLKLHQVALGDEDTILPFNENQDGNLGNSGFVNDQILTDTSSVRVVNIPVRSADDFIQSLGISRLDFAKVDVEGFEPQVFNGLRKTIERYRPLVAFEFHGQMTHPDDFKKISDCLPGYGFYEMFFSPATGPIGDKIKWYLRNGNRAELRKFTEPEARSYDTILAFPSEEMAKRFTSEDRD